MTFVQQTENSYDRGKQVASLTVRSEIRAGAVYTPTQFGNPCPCRLYGTDPNTGATRCLWRAC